MLLARHADRREPRAQNAAPAAVVVPRRRRLERGAGLHAPAELDLALDAVHPARQFGPRQPPRDTCHERVGDARRSGVGAERRHQDVRPREVTPTHRVLTDRLELDAAARIVVEQAPEDRHVVDARQRHPVDLAAQSHQRHRAPIADRRVVAKILTRAVAGGVGHGAGRLLGMTSARIVRGLRVSPRSASDRERLTPLPRCDGVRPSPPETKPPRRRPWTTLEANGVRRPPPARRPGRRSRSGRRRASGRFPGAVSRRARPRGRRVVAR